VTSRRLPFVLLLVYVGFVAYGSFFPFDFAYDPDRIRRVLDHPLPRLHDADGRRVVSLPDVVSNVLLGVPFGALMAWSGLAGGPLATRVLRVVVADALVAGAVETGQLFAPSRTSSLNDVVAQVAGALAGVLLAHALSGASPRPLGPRLARALGHRPTVALLLALAAVLAADALYPYAVTLDVSTVWHNLKRAHWWPLGGLRDAFWPDLLVEKVLPWAALGGLARVALAGVVRTRGGTVAWAAATALGVALEAGKVLIVGRVPSVDGALVAAGGALIGVALAPALARVAAEPARASAWLIATAAALLAYEELTPFGVLRSAAAVRARVARVEWLPFASYYFADPQSALFDVGKKLVLGAALGAAMRHASPRPRLVLVLVLAALLEAAQVFQATHLASVGDALVIYLGALAGAYLVGRGQTLRAGDGPWRPGNCP
jgi:VanZ family protein